MLKLLSYQNGYCVLVDGDDRVFYEVFLQRMFDVYRDKNALSTDDVHLNDTVDRGI